MIAVHQPVILIYGWDKIGEFDFITTTYSYDENTMGLIKVISLPHKPNHISDYNRFKPDVFFVVGHNRQKLKISRFFEERTIYIDSISDEIEFANMALRESIKSSCNHFVPNFSIITPTYKTGNLIRDTYSSIASQTMDDWEWIVVDDSPQDHVETWEILNDIALSDYRVKPFRISPNSKGTIGLAKNRAAGLSDGKWILELDHDDLLLPSCLETCWKASLKFPDAGFIYSDATEKTRNGIFRRYDHSENGDYYGRLDNWFNFGYSGHTWTEVDGHKILTHHYPDINPITIRFNISMPNHVRVWERNLYFSISGHNKNLPIADDFELIIRTFLNTRMIHVKKPLYIQHFNEGGTVHNNAFDINRRSRLIREVYDNKIHRRILDLGFNDWEWDYTKNSSKHMTVFTKIDKSDIGYYEEEQIMNYIYE